jgi:hydroxymethylglutaryl-CoA reductase (NADPH)
VGKLKSVEHYISNKFLYLRFNYYTGDAAGQNMVGKATFLVCEWIKQEYKQLRHYYLESNFATDKKSSQINVIRTRGKRVTAEAVVKRTVLEEMMHTSTEPLQRHHQIANVGGFISHVNNNGCHSANGITAMFIATGQDVANVSESSAAIIYSEITPEKDLYISITVPSLIVATYGGGGVNKLAEIVAGVVLAGEISLGSEDRRNKCTFQAPRRCWVCL